MNADEAKQFFITIFMGILILAGLILGVSSYRNTYSDQVLRLQSEDLILTRGNITFVVSNKGTMMSIHTDGMVMASYFSIGRNAYSIIYIMHNGQLISLQYSDQWTIDFSQSSPLPSVIFPHENVKWVTPAN